MGENFLFSLHLLNHILSTFYCITLQFSWQSRNNNLSYILETLLCNFTFRFAPVWILFSYFLSGTEIKKKICLR
jgi:NhaP-type Na+/H+ or K+/H+ antiporter